MGSTKLAVGLAHLIKSFKPGGLRRISVFFLYYYYFIRKQVSFKKKKNWLWAWPDSYDLWSGV
jgi:hypothetical protein